MGRRFGGGKKAKQPPKKTYDIIEPKETEEGKEVFALIKTVCEKWRTDLHHARR